MDGINSIIKAMQTDLRKLNVIGHNLANVDTNAFKRIVENLKTQNLEKVDNAAIRSERKRVNLDVLSHIDNSNGALKHTGRELNIAIEGDGYFQIRDQVGTWLTRKGELKIDSDGFLTLLDGSKLQGIDGDIQVQPGTIHVKNNGEIYQSDQQAIAKIAIFNAPDQTLVERGAGKYASSSISIIEQPSIRQKFLETSNVNHLQEMVNLVELTRHFEGSQQILQGYSTMMEELISKVGRV
ncbi:flagellar hook-basal body complex protein [uncultured Microbulbifer sp.]|uniref:flagellar hook-basal body protein n=1 Tax=uncultured Microbulbifer sp. TaxID=348147 RepID=UPI0026124979|nr:flagellar hook-basal body complex protein [uncultured Microbulbifer sp.]